MNTKSEEAVKDGGNQRRKSIGGNMRRYSIGITSSRTRIGEEGNNNNDNVPNYLRASTGSCHDFCKYGKKHEHLKSALPVKFTKPVVALENKKAKVKTTLTPFISPESVKAREPVDVGQKVGLLPSKKPQVLKPAKNGNEIKTRQQAGSVAKTSAVVADREGTNGGVKRVDVKTVKKTGVTAKTGGVKVKKIVPKATLNEPQTAKASFSRAASLNTVKYKGVKQVSPLKDQNRMQKSEPKQTVDDSVQTKTLYGVEAEAEVKPETMEFESVQSLMESISDPICNSSESFSGKTVVEEEESMIKHPAYESPEMFTDKELQEESLTAPAVVESSQSCSDKEVLGESLIATPLSESSESFYDDEVLEGESEYTDDDDDDEVVVSEGSETADVSEMETSVVKQNKIPRKGRVVIPEDKDVKAVKLRFRRGKILDLKSEDNGPRRLKFRRRVIESNVDGQNVAARTYKNKTLDVQTDNNGPRKLEFAKGTVMEGNEDKQRVSRRSYKKKYVEENKDSNDGPESVVLKHQGEQGKKDAKGLLNNVIEETASKLVETRKSKVKALVGAFETVISLQDGKPCST